MTLVQVFGDWQEEQFCTGGGRICAAAARVETPQGPYLDDTSLNGMQFECC
jgi:Vitelline membrane outer layer protein I (VOMI)